VIRVFRQEYKKAVDWMLANPLEAGELAARMLPEQGFSAESWTESMQNIDWRIVSADAARDDIEGFLQALSAVSPNFIGGKLPDTGFYRAE
jgi:NitT/TauT family transport system substrate-binding protein